MSMHIKQKCYFMLAVDMCYKVFNYFDFGKDLEVAAMKVTV